MKYDLKDIEPVEDSMVERKLKRNANYAKILLYLNLKCDKEVSRTRVREIAKFFRLEDDYVFRILRFFVDNGLIKKVKQTSKLVYYMPLQKELEKYVDMALKKSKGEI